MHFTELTGTTRLLLMTIIGSSALGYGLTIRNLRLVKFHRNLLVVLKTPFKRAQMELSLSMNDSLLQLLALLNNPCRIFLTHFKHCSHELFCICRVYGLNGTRVFRVGVFDKVEFPFAVFIVKGVSCLYIFQLHSTSYISCIKLVYRKTVGTGAYIDLA